MSALFQDTFTHHVENGIQNHSLDGTKSIVVESLQKEEDDITKL